VISKDGRPPLNESDIARVTRAYRSNGFAVLGSRAIERADVDAACSSWGKRLDVGRTRPGHLLRFVRGSAPA